VGKKEEGREEQGKEVFDDMRVALALHLGKGIS
jgi:hypothetical protein